MAVLEASELFAPTYRFVRSYVRARYYAPTYRLFTVQSPFTVGYKITKFD